MSARRGWRMTATTFGLAAVLFTAGGLGLLGTSAQPTASVTRPAPGEARGDAKATVSQLELRVESFPDDSEAWARLGLAYVEQARAAVDAEFYGKAEAALNRSLRINQDDNFLAASGKASLAAARHKFTQSRTWAKRGLRINPSHANLYGALADAETELGNYAAGMEAVQKMLDINPDASALVRASYTWELRGNTDEARRLMQRALGASANSAQKGFARYFLGELALNSGDASGAVQHFDAGLREAPTFLTLLEGRARAYLALGDLTAALRDFATAAERVPEPYYRVEYGEALEAAGKPAQAAAQYAAFEKEQQIQERSGVALDLDAVLFYADHGDPAKAVAIATELLRTRRFVKVYDAYAWALHRSGRHSEAAEAEAQALALGTQDPMFEFHAAEIDRALGRNESALAHYRRAVQLNPGFNALHAPTAHAAIEQLQGA